MRASISIVLVLAIAGCAYDLLGIEGPTPEDDGDVSLPDGLSELEASSVAPGCAGEGLWCERTPVFVGSDDIEAPPGELRAVVAAADGRIWAGGQDFSIFRWDGTTWFREFTGIGELDELWVAESGRGIAIGNVNRKRRIMRREPTGKWIDVTLPSDMDEGELHGATGISIGGKLFFIVTTRSKVIFKIDQSGEVEVLDVPAPFGPVTTVASAGTPTLLFGESEGVWRMEFSPAISFVQELGARLEVRGFVVDRDWVWALAAGQIRRRPANLAAGWTTETSAQIDTTLVAGCGSHDGQGATRLLGRDRIFVREETGWWKEPMHEDVRGITLLACALAPDGTAWAVGFYSEPKLQGAILERRVD